jgi:hypothetical protein
MKTQNVLKNGSLLILGLFITSMVWSNNMIVKVSDQETLVENTEVKEVEKEPSALIIVDESNTSGGDFYNFPDPFTSNTTVVFEIKQTTHVKLMIYVGQNLITTLVDEVKSAGTYTVEWNAGFLPAGEYVGFLVTNYGSFLESMTKKANIAIGSGEEDDQ